MGDICTGQFMVFIERRKDKNGTSLVKFKSPVLEQLSVEICDPEFTLANSN